MPCHCSPFCHLRDIFPQPGEVFLIEGGFGSTAKLSFLPMAPSLRELSSECETEGVPGSSYSINKRGLLRQKGTFHAYPDL